MRLRRLLIVALAVSPWLLLASNAIARDLTFEDRVNAQEATERVYYSHQIGATKPFEEAMPRAVLEWKVRTYLRESVALETYWKTPITADALRRELERIARETRMPERLREVYEALHDDPLLVEECVARPVLADRLVRSFFADDRGAHASERHAALALRGELEDGRLDPFAEHPDRSVVDLAREDAGFEGPVASGGHRPARLTLSAAEFERSSGRLLQSVGEIGPLMEEHGAFVIQVVLDRTPGNLRVATFLVKKRSWDDWWSDVAAGFDEASVASVARDADPLPRPGATLDGAAVAPCATDDTWDNGSLDDLPSPRSSHTSVWTGSLVIVWGGVGRSFTNTGSRYDPVTDSWSSMSTLGAPSPRWRHVAVWTGDTMVVWGGAGSVVASVGGRYDPLTDQWTPISAIGAPSPREFPSGVWTGSEMIVWGGAPANATGGRYDPSLDLWTETSTIGAPSGRFLHSAVWTGSEMVIWGGDGGGANGLSATGGRYDPATDQWTPTSTVGAPTHRRGHTAVWTGSRMIVWGGDLADSDNTSGGLYDPIFDYWTPTSTTNAPVARRNHSAVWTGSRMLIWGGSPEGIDPYFDSGGRYDPATDQWTPTSTVGAPSPRGGHSAVWTGSRMVVWGGFNGSVKFDSGGRYDPATDAWTPTSRPGGAFARSSHTAVWTGNVMVIWGGYDLPGGNGLAQTGGRYDPVTDSFAPTSSLGAPSARASHSAVWTGDRMVVWGGAGVGSVYTDTGGRYDPGTDTWTPTSTAGAPSPRGRHTAVWSGERMIVWGGAGPGAAYTNTGARYDPEADEWTPMSTTGAPSPRLDHTAVWTGDRMVVWGGVAGQDPSFIFFNTGGRYDPVNDSWTPTTLANAPFARVGHTAVWTGSRMLVWGGQQYHSVPPNIFYAYFSTGGSYDPANDAWSATATSGAPTSRAYHTAVWTGSSLVVWGGLGDSGGAPAPLGTGGRYEPLAGTWSPTSTIEAPTPRSAHTAVWTGSFMVVWGGDASGGRYAVGQDVDDDQDGWTTCEGDCNDADPAVHPGATERCNAVDVNCDGQIDEGFGVGLSCTEPVDACHQVVGATQCRPDGTGTECGGAIVFHDTTPPEITLVVDPGVLWPPNHSMIPVSVGWQVQDVCDPNPAVALVSVTSSEPDDAAGYGDGATTTDIQGAEIGTPDTVLVLRAERDGKGSGRVYMLTYRAQDGSGNAAPAVATVMVPHDQGQGPEPLLMQVAPTFPGSTNLHIYRCPY